MCSNVFSQTTLVVTHRFTVLFQHGCPTMVDTYRCHQLLCKCLILCFLSSLFLPSHAHCTYLCSLLQCTRWRQSSTLRFSELLRYMSFSGRVLIVESAQAVGVTAVLHVAGSLMRSGTHTRILPSACLATASIDGATFVVAIHGSLLLLRGSSTLLMSTLTMREFKRTPLLHPQL